MPLRAIDFHVHLPTPDWLDGSMAGYVEAAEAYFRSTVSRQSLEDLAGQYRRLELKAVLLAWDAETATGRPRVPNETVATACRDYPDVFTGMGSVDPHKGEAAIRELRGRLSGQFLWGSDYPFIAPERCLSELDELDLPDAVMRAVLHDNAARVLRL